MNYCKWCARPYQDKYMDVLLKHEKLCSARGSTIQRSNEKLQREGKRILCWLRLSKNGKYLLIGVVNTEELGFVSLQAIRGMLEGRMRAVPVLTTLQTGEDTT